MGDYHRRIGSSPPFIFLSRPKAIEYSLYFSFSIPETWPKSRDGFSMLMRILSCIISFLVIFWEAYISGKFNYFNFWEVKIWEVDLISYLSVCLTYHLIDIRSHAARSKILSSKLSQLQNQLFPPPFRSFPLSPSSSHTNSFFFSEVKTMQKWHIICRACWGTYTFYTIKMVLQLSGKI